MLPTATMRMRARDAICAVFIMVMVLMVGMRGGPGRLGITNWSSKVEAA